MTDFDDRLRASLSIEDEEFLKNLEGERGLFTQLFDTFQGPMGLWTALGFLFTLVFVGLGFYCAYQVFQVTETREIILWALGVILSFNAVSMLKMWMFNRMNMLAILREVKRLELRIARLSDKD
ncbi:MAG: DUF6768 family protein [Hyphomonadaceae bacterium]